MTVVDDAQEFVNGRLAAVAGESEARPGETGEAEGTGRDTFRALLGDLVPLEDHDDYMQTLAQRAIWLHDVGHEVDCPEFSRTLFLEECMQAAFGFYVGREAGRAEKQKVDPSKLIRRLEEIASYPAACADDVVDEVRILLTDLGRGDLA